MLSRNQIFVVINRYGLVFTGSTKDHTEPYRLVLEWTVFNSLLFFFLVKLDSTG